MRVTVSPLVAALGVAVAIAGAGTVVAVARHQSHPARTTGSSTAADAGLITLSPSTPTPRPLPPPPAGVDLIWRTVNGSDDTLEALDWSGKLVGRLQLPVTAGNVVGVSPDGQRLVVSNGADEMISAQGQVLVPQLPGSDAGLRFTWSDDDTHLCGLRSTPGGVAQLFLYTAGGGSRLVTSLPDPDGMSLAACSVKSDLAVLMSTSGQDNGGHITDYRVLRLSTGRTLRNVTPPEPDLSGSVPRAVPGSLSYLGASPDARLLVLQPYTGMLDPRPPYPVVDTVSGRLLGHVGDGEPTFVGDDRAVVRGTGLVDWRTGRVVTAVAGCCDSVTALDPGGAAMVVAIATGPPPTPSTSGSSEAPPPDDYVLVRADGSRATIACCGATVLSSGQSTAN